ncbi:hypothetical protein V8E55_009749 [Tylopilus felleus]
MWCVGALVPLSCCFSVPLLGFGGLENMWCVGTLVPLLCCFSVLILGSGAQRTHGFGGMLSMHGVWGRLSPSHAISSWARGLREYAVCGDTCPPLVPSLLGLGGSENMWIWWDVENV